LRCREEEFLNPFYDPGQDPANGILRPNLASQAFVLWGAMYCRWEPDSLPKQPLLRSYEYYTAKLARDKARLAEAKAKVGGGGEQRGLRMGVGF
jgi:hypothetical protein